MQNGIVGNKNMCTYEQICKNVKTYVYMSK